MDNLQSTIHSDLDESVELLSDALVNSEPMKDYLQANDIFKADHEVMAWMQEYSSLQQTIRTQQQTNQPTKGNLERSRELMALIENNKTFQNYSSAQESAILFLREINQEISQMIGFDFASLTQRGGCC